MSIVKLEIDLNESLGFDWFQGDFGYGDEVTLDNKIVKARKKHDCHHCNNEIQAGEKHRMMKERFEGELHTFRWCQKCCIGSILSMDGFGPN